MLCKICGNTSEKIFDALVLSKYQINYLRCNTCKFIQTEEPFWLNEAYSSAIGVLDIGLINRNIQFSDIISTVLNRFSTKEDSYLDYGGGYGVFVRMMRDKGYDFYLYDKYCENLFAKFFELDNHNTKKFAALTAFEVFEHLVNPLDEVSKMWEYSDVIIFSTELQPDIPLRSEKDWWYFVPFGGQHISFYHAETLKMLSNIFKCEVYSNGTNLHILSKRSLKDPFELQTMSNKLSLILRNIQYKIENTNSSKRQSLVSQDLEFYKKKLNII